MRSEGRDTNAATPSAAGSAIPVEMGRPDAVVEGNYASRGRHLHIVSPSAHIRLAGVTQFDNVRSPGGQERRGCRPLRCQYGLELVRLRPGGNA